MTQMTEEERIALEKNVNKDSTEFKETTPRQRKLWDKAKKVRSIVSDGVRPDSEVYDALFKTVVNQEIINFYRGNPSYGNVFGKEAWMNGLKDFFAQSLYEGQELDNIRNDVVIGDFNADDNEFEQITAKVDTFYRMRWVIPASGFVEVFASPKKLEAFTDARVLQAVNTYDQYIFTQKSKILLNMTGAKLNIVWDKTVNLGTEIDFALESKTDAKVKDALEKMRIYVGSLATASKTHLAINKDKWLYSAKPENLLMIVNNKFNNQISTLVSTLFNKDDVLLNVKKVVVDFSKIEGMTETKADKIKALIIDKNALLVGKQTSLTKQIILPTVNNLMLSYTWFGFARLKWFAMAKFITT